MAPDASDSISHSILSPKHAVNAFEALREINRRVFHAYVLEYWLPDWSAVQICRHIRKSDPRVPVIIYGGAERDEDRARAFGAESGNSALPPLYATCSMSRPPAATLNSSPARCVGLPAPAEA